MLANKSNKTVEKELVNEILNQRKALVNAVGLTANPISKVRVGIIGMGNRGSALIQMFDYLIKNNHAEIVALSDLKQDKVEKNNEYLKTIQGSGK